MTFVTEDQAERMWCPFGRAFAARGEHGAAAINLATDRNRHDYRTNCIASTCMQWRWAPKRLANGQIVPAHRGFCGLAGQPEA